MSDLIVLALVLVAAGGLSGFLAGLFGVGGGTVVVPTPLCRLPDDRCGGRVANAALRRHVVGTDNSDLDHIVHHPSQKGCSQFQSF